MGNLISVFKVDKNMRKYIECFDIPIVNEDLVMKKLDNVTLTTPEDEVKLMFKGLCKVRTREDFKKIRFKRLLVSTFTAALFVMLFSLYIMLNF